jgi:hypothetical protein
MCVMTWRAVFSSPYFVEDPPTSWGESSEADQVGGSLITTGMAVANSDGFGGGSDSGGFGPIPSSPTGCSFEVLYSLYGRFDPTEMGSGFGRIRTDSRTPNMEVANPRRRGICPHVYTKVRLRPEGLSFSDIDQSACPP